MKLIKRFGTNKLFLLISLVGLLFLFSAIESSSFFNKQNSSGEKELSEKIIKEEDEKSLDKENEEEGKSEIEIEIEEEPTPTENPVNTPTPAPKNDSNGLDSFTYPNGSVSNNANSSVIINSSDNPTQITNWYEDKIEEHNMNTTSVVRTNTNGEVLNKIAASNGELSIEVEISRSNNDSNTEITVKIL